jgi:hypothetical protein
MRSSYLFLIFSTVAVVTFLIMGCVFFIRWVEEPQIASYRATQALFVDDFLKDRNALDAESWLHQNSNTTQKDLDAGEQLNPRLIWYPFLKNEEPVSSEKILSLPKNGRTDITNRGSEWMKLFYKYNKLPIDFSIFEALKNKTYWDLEENSPLAELIKKQHFVNSFERPLPELSDLALLTKLYAMRCVEKCEPIQALQAIRHLSDLLLTTEYLDTELAAFTFLKIEKQAYDYYLKKGRIKDSQWQPRDLSILPQVQRVYLASRGYLHLWSSPLIIQKVFTPAAHIALCSSINEDLPNDWLLRPLLEPTLWPEPSFAAGYIQLQTVVAQAEPFCRLKYVRATMKSNQLGHVPLPGWIVRWPYIRKLFGLQFSELDFSGFENYAAIKDL